MSEAEPEHGSDRAAGRGGQAGASVFVTGQVESEPAIEPVPSANVGAIPGRRSASWSLRIRRTATPLRLAFGRVLHQWQMLALVALGVAVGASTLAAVLGGGLVVRDRGLSRALERVPARERSVQVAHFGLAGTGGDYSSVDRAATSALARLGFGAPARVVEFKPTRIGGAEVVLAGLDRLPRWVRLTAGRMPRPCRASRCEVLIVGDGGTLERTAQLPIVAVGRGRLASTLPFGRLGTPAGKASETLGRRRPPVFALAEGVPGLAGLPVLSAIYRAYAWVVPLPSGKLHPWNVDAFSRALLRTKAGLQHRSSGFDVAAPLPELLAAEAAGETSSRRLLLLGGQAVVLLLAFAAFAAGALRRNLEAARRRLTWFGARRWQLAILAGTEAGAVAFASAAVGWLAGALLTMVVAAKAGSPASALVGNSLFSLGGLAAAAALATAAAVLLVVAVRARPVSLAGRQVTPLDMTAVGALVAIAVGYARGDAETGGLAAGGETGAFLLVLPALVLLVLVVAFARLFGPALRIVQRVGPRTAVAFRLAALSLASRPGYAATASGFLVVSVGLSLFSLVYRSTLTAGIRDEVDYAFPADFIVREDVHPDRLVPPLRAAPLARYRELIAGARASPVIRQSGSFARIAGSDRLTVVALPAGDLGWLRGWRSDFSGTPLRTLAQRLAPSAGMRLRGLPLPADARALSLRLSLRGDDITLKASVATRSGDFATVDLGRTRGAATHMLTGALPPEARGGRLLGFEFGRLLGVEGHAQDNVPVLLADVELGALEAVEPDGRRTVLARDYLDWLPRGDNTQAGARGQTLSVAVSGVSESAFRLRQPTDDGAIPAAVTPGLAAAADDEGILTVRVPSGPVEVRVVGVARRFPTVAGDFVLADQRTLSVALNARNPGTGVANEIWVEAPAGREPAAASQLRRPPFDDLAVDARQPFRHAREGDPLARGTLVIILGSAAVAFALALLALLLFLLSEVRDEHREFFDLESQGAGPAMLRRHLWLRLALIGLPGVVGGMLAAAILATLAVDLVSVTAAAGAPNPPLLLHVDWTLVLAALAGYAATGAAIGLLVGRWAFRARNPRQGST